ncbi:MAG TPA: HD domain-containing phosphohydrolase [Polyangia bacterium]|nr:HD domain-containing phosphohydrolase [Polyangia bacterium]
MSKPDGAVLTRILCVDDEPAVLEGLALHLRRRYHLETATSGAEGLLVLRKDPGIAVVVSDMRMPGMDGAAFLTRARETTPDTVRMLLTGQADMDATIAAINQGGIFRFLTKPCAPRILLTAIEAAVEQHRLVTAERVLLEQTLHGSIKALTEILALVNPVAFGRATRIKAVVSELCGKLQVRETWQVEVAAMLSQLGVMTLPPETAEKLHAGVPLTPDEQKMAARAPAVTEQLVRNVPRLDGVADILAAQGRKRKTAEAAAVDLRVAQLEMCAQLLRAAVDFDALDSQGNSGAMAVETMRGRGERYEPRVVDALAELRSGTSARVSVREVSIAVLCAGMVFIDDVKMQNGTLLVARGFEVTPGFLERIRNLKPGVVKEPLRVTLKASG